MQIKRHSVCSGCLFAYKNPSSQAYAHVFPANFFRITALKMLAIHKYACAFCLVCVKIVLGNPHIYLVETDSKNGL